MEQRLQDHTKAGPEQAKKPGFWSSLGRRLLVHLIGLMAFGHVSDILPEGTATANSLSLGVYFGIICLFPRGIWTEPRWYFPTATGLLQTAILSFLGMPWFLACFWGGVQTWLQRTIVNRGRMGREWVVAPFLLICALNFIETPYPPHAPLWSLTTLLLVGLVGFGGYSLYMRVRSKALYKARLMRALQRFQNFANNPRLDDTTKKQISILIAQSPGLESVELHANDAGRRLVEQMENASLEVEKALNMPSVTKSGWSGELFRGQTWGRVLGKKVASPPLHELIRQCNAHIMDVLRNGPDSSRQGSSSNSLDVFEHQARQLICKASQAPARIATHLDAIGLATFDIVKSMRDDPRDRPNGERFLQRYLPAANHIADEYGKLVSSNNSREDVAQAIVRGEEVLSRLKKAFEDERHAMLANDSASFTAELNALDKLLQMTGH